MEEQKMAHTRDKRKKTSTGSSDTQTMIPRKTEISKKISK